MSSLLSAVSKGMEKKEIEQRGVDGAMDVDKRNNDTVSSTPERPLLAAMNAAIITRKSEGVKGKANARSQGASKRSRKDNMTTLNKIWSSGRKDSGDDEEFKDALENVNDAVEFDVAKDSTSLFNLGSASAKINRTLLAAPRMTLKSKQNAKTSSKNRTPSAIKKGTGNLFGSIKKKSSVKAKGKEGAKVQWSDKPTCKHKIIVEITVPVQITQGKKTKELFESRLSNSMDFIRRCDFLRCLLVLSIPKKKLLTFYFSLFF